MLSEVLKEIIKHYLYGENIVPEDLVSPDLVRQYIQSDKQEKIETPNF